MRVAAVQFKGDRSDLANRRDALARWISGIGPGVELVVCPELAVTGYVFADREEASKFAEAPLGPTFQALAPIAKTSGTWIVCGFIEVDGDDLFNSAMVISPTGALEHVYRKSLLYELDERWATPGQRDYRVFSTAHGTFSVAICMDLNDPECIAWLKDAAPDVLAFPTNWVEEGADVWAYWAWRLADTDCALVAANTWGVEQETQFSGRSAILQRRPGAEGSPQWWALAAAEKELDSTMVAMLRK